MKARGLRPAAMASSWRRLSTQSAKEDVFVALGSNIGNRAGNMRAALGRIKSALDVHRTSFLYETEPMYRVEQPPFLNAVVHARTALPPLALLAFLKSVEAEMGRDPAAALNSPRPIDLDIVTYGQQLVQLPHLTIPHPRIAERDFVLGPICDIDPDLHIPTPDGNSHSAAALLAGLRPSLARVTPTASSRLLRWPRRTLLMGVLNATPDSFSDGGLNIHQDTALDHARRFVDAGFDVIDIGGQSTRPGAETVAAQEELNRVIRIIEAVRADHPDIIISCDTFHASVASAAISQGADIINDISAGRLDHRMHETIAKSGAACVCMHMRGEPRTMRNHARYTDVVAEAGLELHSQLEDALDAGVPRWSILSDPGIGFAKTAQQSIALIRDMPSFRQAAGKFPTVLGVSRKSFLHDTAGDDISRRDWATAGVVAAAVARGGVDMVRVHSASVADAVRAADLFRD